MTYQAEKYLDKKMFQRIYEGTRDAIILSFLLGVIAGFGLAVAVLHG